MESSRPWRWTPPATLPSSRRAPAFLSGSCPLRFRPSLAGRSSCLPCWSHPREYSWLLGPYEILTRRNSTVEGAVMRTTVMKLLALASLAVAAAVAGQTAEDPFQWLEEVSGEKALAWAKGHNAKSTAVLGKRPEYQPIFKRSLEILDSKEKIPDPKLYGETVYNFWKDDTHERGIWRRTTLASYRTAAPQWETVLDVDALAKAEGKSWVFHGATCLPPSYARCMLNLSVGGSDASVEREFDTKAKQFVEAGFSLPEAKSNVAWRDEDT